MPDEHQWLGSWLRGGVWRGGCTCGERFSSSAPTGPYRAFTAHVDEVEANETAEVD